MIKNNYIKIIVVVFIILVILGIFFYKRSLTKNDMDFEKIAELNNSIKKDEAVKNTVKKVLEFKSEDCLPCKQMKVVLKELKEEYEGVVDFIEIDIYEHIDMSEKYKIMYTPTLIFLDENDNEISRYEAFIGKSKIKKIIENGGSLNGII